MNIVILCVDENDISGYPARTMNSGFWGMLPKPFFVLAPMADVTDVVFREVIAERGKPDVFYTEFVSVDGLCSPGREALSVDLRYTENQRPIVAQIFGATPEHFTQVAELIREMGFDGIDINMGCPAKEVEKQGAGAALMKKPKLAREIIRATRAGAGDLPISVKTRIGYNKPELSSWVPELLAEDIAALVVHARTRKEMSLVPAQWEAVAEVVAMAKGSGTLIVGNGDVCDVTHGRELAEQTGADGIMIGRGIFGNPWLFNKEQKEISQRARLLTLVEHTNRYEKEFNGIKSFALMKKHFKAYVTGFDGAKELRVRLMDAGDAGEVTQIIEEYLARSSAS